MFDPESRYAGLQVLEQQGPDGRMIRFVERRFLPRSEGMRALGAVAVADGDRLDLITARTLGDPLQYHRICDANDALHPPDLVADPGRRLKIPAPI